jgi:hypothetical protein
MSRLRASCAPVGASFQRSQAVSSGLTSSTPKTPKPLLVAGFRLVLAYRGGRTRTCNPRFWRPVLSSRVRVRCAYGFVSRSRVLPQLPASASAGFCRLFPCSAVCCRLLARTHNPLVPGSNPGGPIAICRVFSLARASASSSWTRAWACACSATRPVRVLQPPVLEVC